MNTNTLFGGLFLTLAGCAHVETPEERLRTQEQAWAEALRLVDNKAPGFNEDKYLGRDWRDCQNYTERAISQNTVEENIMLGALGGAALGAMTGAWVDDPGLGAAMGSSYGAVGGAAQTVPAGEIRSDDVLRNCLKGRGYIPLF